VTVRNRLRVLLLFNPPATVALSVLAVFLVVATPVMVLVPYGWVACPLGILLAFLLWRRLRTRYRMSILDSSPLGVVTWLQMRR
jgi:hypothetical protein